MNRLSETISLSLDSSLRKEGHRNADFSRNFKELVKKLSIGYRIDGEVYSQESSLVRLKTGASLNEYSTYLDAVQTNPSLIEEAVTTYSSEHRGHDTWNDKVTMKIGDIDFMPKDLVGTRPDSQGYNKKEVIAVLAHRAARTAMLISGGEKGISEAYATAWTCANQANELVNDAALLTYNWDSSWGRLSPDAALLKAAGRLTKSNVRRTMIVGALIFAGCQTMAPTITSENTPIVEAAPAASPMPTEVKIPSPPVVSSNSTEVAPTAVPENVQIVLPDSINDFDLSARGGSQEQLRNKINDLSKGDVADMEGWWISKAWRDGLLGGAQTYDEAKQEFEKKYHFTYDMSQSAWTVVMQENGTNRVGYATGLNGIPFVSLMPLGVPDLDSFNLKFADMVQGGVTQNITHDKDGNVFSVIVYGPDGKPMAWMNLSNGSMNLESPFTIPAGLEGAPESVIQMAQLEGYGHNENAVWDREGLAHAVKDKTGNWISFSDGNWRPSDPELAKEVQIEVYGSMDLAIDDVVNNKQIKWTGIDTIGHDFQEQDLAYKEFMRKYFSLPFDPRFNNDEYEDNILLHRADTGQYAQIRIGDMTRTELLNLPFAQLVYVTQDGIWHIKFVAGVDNPEIYWPYTLEVTVK